MKMEHRKPRATRFEAHDHEARLARLREQAPTLGYSRKLRIYAIFGSVLMVLTVAAFYFAIQIYKALVAEREEDARIEVEIAVPPGPNETELALQRLEAEQAAEEAAYQEQLEALRQIDLLAEPDP